MAPDAAGYLSLTRQGIEEDFVPDLPAGERALVFATQGPWNSTALAETVPTPAWKSKPSWFIAVNHRILPADYELVIAKHQCAQDEAGFGSRADVVATKGSSRGHRRCSQQGRDERQPPA
jgi:hypothetical protein